MNYNRLKELMFDTLELLRTQMTEKYGDSKDADSYIFSELDMTAAEIEELYVDSDKSVYAAAAFDDRDIPLAEQHSMLSLLHGKILEECGFDTVQYSPDSKDASIAVSEGEGVQAVITVRLDRESKCPKYHISYDAGHDSDEIMLDAVEEVIDDLNGTNWDASDWL